jgi:putative FmdB family regulatory protein
MPTYEYACSHCGNQWDEIQKISDAALEECPKCHEKTARRLISQGNFILKGGGWYTTGGYGSPAKTSESSTSASTSSSTATTSSADPKGDAKGESTAAPAAASEPAKSDTAAKPSSS